MRKRSITSIVSIVLLVFMISLISTACGTNEAGKETSSGSLPVSASQFPPAAVEFSRESGAFEETSFDLELSAPKEYSIYYTTDGSVPDTASNLYETALQISGNGNDWLTEEIAESLCPDGYEVFLDSEFSDAWVIRAVAYAPDGTAGPVTTKTYFPGTNFKNEYGEIAVFSIVTDPTGLLDYESGIMVKGKIFDDAIASGDYQELIEEGRYEERGEVLDEAGETKQKNW